jgi:hypothetical protein
MNIILTAFFVSVPNALKYLTELNTHADIIIAL